MLRSMRKSRSLAGQMDSFHKARSPAAFVHASILERIAWRHFGRWRIYCGNWMPSRLVNTRSSIKSWQHVPDQGWERKWKVWDIQVGGCGT